MGESEAENEALDVERYTMKCREETLLAETKLRELTVRVMLRHRIITHVISRAAVLFFQDKVESFQLGNEQKKQRLEEARRNLKIQTLLTYSLNVEKKGCYVFLAATDLNCCNIHMYIVE